jgi:thiol-disulfide isomerase/thioredoxin
MDLERRRDPSERARKAQTAAGKDPKEFTFDRSADLAALEKRIAEERIALCREYLLLRYFEVPGAENSVRLARQVFKEVPATSMVWTLLFGGPDAHFNKISKIANLPEQEAKYTQQVYDTHPDKRVRAAFLYTALMKAHAKGDAQTVGRLYTRLLGDFSDTPYPGYAKRIAPERSIQPGKAVPDFEFASLDDSKVITAQSMKDKVYLIDFWAVWCGPCVAEMKVLHDAFEKYKSRGLTILSISLDDSAEAVAKFRKSKWPMPWFNTLLDGGFDNRIAKSFELVGVPKPILVGKDGQILATEGDLRGDKLDQTLARFFPSPKYP